MPFDRQACAGVPPPIRGKLTRSRPNSARLIERSPAASVDRQRDETLAGHLRPLQPCTVCRVEPLIFQECPACSARYCAGGCLHSWYEHDRRERTNRAQTLAVPVTVQSSEEDYITVEFTNGQELELGLSRFAGGMVVAEDSSRRKSGSDKLPRWSITSVDGWDVGQPGPGAKWTPARGVQITLEELGSCAQCRTPQALPEYICNSAGRDGVRSNSRSRLLSQGGAAVQKPRIRTEEVGLQAVVKTADAQTQTEPERADAETQGPSEDEVIAQAQVAIAGLEIAELAMPSAGNADAQELVLTADRARAKQQIHTALCAVARLVAPQHDTVTGSHAALVDAACSAVGSLERAAGTPKLQETSDRTRILSSAACLPNTEDAEAGGHEAGLDLPVETRAALASAALKTLGEIREAQSEEEMENRNLQFLLQQDLSAEVASLPPALSGAEKDKHYEAERQLLSRRDWAPRADLDKRVRLHEVLANVAASLCGCPIEGDKLMEVLHAVHAVSLLVPVHGSVPWRRLACAEVWPWLQSSNSDPIEPPRGWPALRTALAALSRLGSMPFGAITQSELGAALRSLAGLELFIDAEAEREERAQAAERARLEEERSKAEEEETKRAEEAKLAAEANNVNCGPPTVVASSVGGSVTEAVPAASSADSKPNLLDLYLGGGSVPKPGQDLGGLAADPAPPAPIEAPIFGKKKKGRGK